MSKKFLLMVGVVGLVLSTGAFAPKSNAEEGSPFNASGNIALTSDYVWRGISQTDADPAIQGGVDWSFYGLYWGFWGSNVELGVSHLELDVYAGYSQEFHPNFSVSVGALRYQYFKGDLVSFFEFPVAFNFHGVSVGYALSLDIFGTGEFGGYVSGSYTFSLPWEFGFSVAVGNSHFASATGLTNYTDFRIGLSRDVLGTTMDISMTAVTPKTTTPLDDTRGIFTISKSI